jgi:hypothetical protein
MGKLRGLLSSGIGLAMEAASSQSSQPPRVYDSSRYESKLSTIGQLQIPKH